MTKLIMYRLFFPHHFSVPCIEFIKFMNRLHLTTKKNNLHLNSTDIKK